MLGFWRITRPRNLWRARNSPPIPQQMVAPFRNQMGADIHHVTAQNNENQRSNALKKDCDTSSSCNVPTCVNVLAPFLTSCAWTGIVTERLAGPSRYRPTHGMSECFSRLPKPVRAAPTRAPRGYPAGFPVGRALLATPDMTHGQSAGPPPGSVPRERLRTSAGKPPWSDADASRASGPDDKTADAANPHAD
jgi:hypothetical protein